MQRIARLYGVPRKQDAVINRPTGGKDSIRHGLYELGPKQC